jgi:hypothetical protein
MSYIKYEEISNQKALICTHPKVKKVWEWGGCSINPTSKMVRYISIQLDNDEVIQFREDDETAETKVDNYLNELNESNV